MKSIVNNWLLPLFRNLSLIDPEKSADVNFNLKKIVEDELVFTGREEEFVSKCLIYNDKLPFGVSPETAITAFNLQGRRYYNTRDRKHQILTFDDSNLNYNITHYLHFVNKKFVAGVLQVQPIYIQPIAANNQLDELFRKMTFAYKSARVERAILTDAGGNMLIPSSLFGIRMIYLSASMKPATEIIEKLLSKNETASIFSENKIPKMAIAHF